MPLAQPTIVVAAAPELFAATIIVTAPGATRATVYRKNNNPYIGASPVRSATDVPISGGFWYGTDWEIPQSDTLSYYVQVTDGNETVNSLITTVPGLDLGYDRISVFDSPLTGMKINVEGVADLTHKVIQESARPLGRRDTVTVTYGRSMPEGVLRFITLSDDERIEFLRIVSEGKTIMFQPRKNYGFEEPLFLSVGDVKEGRPSKFGGEPSRVFECDVVSTLPPPAQFEIPIGSLWIDKADSGLTWNDVATSGVTWLEWAQVS